MAETPVSRLAIAGAMGRMGQAILGVVEGRKDLTVSALCDRPGSEGQAAGSLTLVTREAVLGMADVLLDFSTAEAGAKLAAAAAARGGPALVIGATGWSDEQNAAVQEASAKIPIVKSGNYSLGVNVLTGLVEQAARALAGQDWDIEVFEAHHKRKVDAPSGTALMLGEAAARGRGIDLASHSERARDGISAPRAEGAIGFASLRLGGVIGEHSVTFASEDEILTLSHSARDRSRFARGAVAAAAWVVGKPPGLYDMKDVLGFR
jgi:4-hydroxy-tetrahydrodipicolinate reductase